MPVPDGDVGFFAQVIETDELIIDERFEGADVEGAHACGRVLPKLGQDGKEGCLGFAGSCGCRQEHIILRVKDGISCCNLNGAQALPIVGVDEVLDKRGVAVKGVHEASFQKRISQRGGQWLAALLLQRLPR